MGWITYEVYSSMDGDECILTQVRARAAPSLTACTTVGPCRAVQEMALALGQLLQSGGVTLHNRVRLAWWGAEEEGLLGSHWYRGQPPSARMYIRCALPQGSTPSALPAASSHGGIRRCAS